MFCKYCGSPCETGVCPDCAAKQAQPQTQPQQPQQPQAQPLQLGVKNYLHLIVAFIAVLALVWGVLNVFCVFHVNANVSAMGLSESNYVSVSDAADAMDSYDSSAVTIYIGNILFGLANLAVAAIGILYFLKVSQNKPYYDQFIGSKIKFRPAFLMGLLGAVGAILQVIMYLFCSAGGSSWGVKMKVSFGVNWTTWMMLVIFVGIAVLDKFYLEKQDK